MCQPVEQNPAPVATVESDPELHDLEGSEDLLKIVYKKIDHWLKKCYKLGGCGSGYGILNQKGTYHENQQTDITFFTCKDTAEVTNTTMPPRTAMVMAIIIAHTGMEVMAARTDTADIINLVR